MMIVESANGYVREVFVAPVLGALRARQLGVLAGSVLVLLIAWLTARWVATSSRRERLLVGAYWVVLTVVFELALGRALDQSWSRLLSDYNPADGGLMLAGLAVMFIAPLVTAGRTSPRESP